MASSAAATQLLIGIVLAAPLVGLCLFGVYVAWHRQQVYKRIGNYRIGLATFHMQLEYPGVNFPGPNILEAQIAAQPADLRAYVGVVRRRIRHLRWATLSYMGFLLALALVLSVLRRLSS
jgi:hypothetical protein